MKTITNIDQFWETVTKLTFKHYHNKKPQIRVSTFGMFASHQGSYLLNFFANISSMTDKLKVYIAVGMSKYTPCKEGCLDCYNKYCKSVIALNNHLKAHPFIDSALVYDTHMKLVMLNSVDEKGNQVFDYIVGGINFGDSQWNDSAVHLEGENPALLKLFTHIFYDAKRFDFKPNLMPDEVGTSEYGLIKFGKHKGRTWKEVNESDPQYVAWARRENLKVEM